VREVRHERADDPQDREMIPTTNNVDPRRTCSRYSERMKYGELRLRARLPVLARPIGAHTRRGGAPRLWSTCLYCGPDSGAFGLMERTAAYPARAAQAPR
jgi:hypothetical protein